MDSDTEVMDADTEFMDIVEDHERALELAHLPTELWERFFQKLYPSEIYDAGNHFILLPTAEEECESNEVAPQLFAKGAYTLHATTDLNKEQDVFIIDQFWTSDGSSKAREQLNEMPELCERLTEMFGISINDSNDNLYDQVLIIQEMYSVNHDQAQAALKQYNGCLLDSLMFVDSPELFGSEEKRPEDSGANLKCSLEEFKEELSRNIDESVVNIYSNEYINKMYMQFLNNANGKEPGSGTTAAYSWIDDFKDGTVYVYIPVDTKVKKGQVKSILTSNGWKFLVDEKEILAGKFPGKIISDESYWSFESPGLVCMALQKQGDDDIPWDVLLEGEEQLSLSEITHKKWAENLNKLANVKATLDKMWYFNHTRQSYYLPRRVIVPLWYVCDEVGTAIPHNSSPNVMSSNLCYKNKGVTYNMIWPAKDIKQDERITRQMFPPLTEKQSVEDFKVREHIFLSNKSFISTVPTDLALCAADLSIDDEGENSEKLGFKCIEIPSTLPKTCIYSNIVGETLKNYLAKFSGVTVTNDIAEASVLLLCPGTRTYNLQERHKLNSLYSESLYNLDSIVNKVTAKYGNVAWLPKFYNLHSDFRRFCNAYESKGYGQLWFMKSAIGHGMHFDPVITSNLLRMSRLSETGSVLATEYIRDTVLYNGKKFALSYTAIIVGSNPRRILLHNRPFIRVAKNKFKPLDLYDEYDNSSMKSHHDYETVGHQDSSFFQDFISYFEASVDEQGKKRKWADTEANIKSILGRLCLAISPVLSDDSPAQSFGLYGVDVILCNSQQPIIVDVDFFPTFADKDVLFDVIRVIFASDVDNKTLVPVNSFSEVVSNCG